MVDSARNVYVSGSTEGQLPGATSLGGSTDGFLMKYDKDGVQQWLIQIGSVGADQAYGLTIDANDYLYVALQTDGTIGATNLGSPDIAVMQVNSAGSIEWTEQFGTSGGDYLRSGGNALAVDSAGDLFITGFTNGAFTNYSNQGGNDWFLYKIEAKSTTTSSSSATSTVTSTSSTTSSTTSSATRSSRTTSSTTSTSSSSTGSVTSTSTSSRSLVALVADWRGFKSGSKTL